MFFFDQFTLFYYLSLIKNTIFIFEGNEGILNFFFFSYNFFFLIIFFFFIFN